MCGGGLSLFYFVGVFLIVCVIITRAPVVTTTNYKKRKISLQAKFNKSQRKKNFTFPRKPEEKFASTSLKKKPLKTIITNIHHL